MRISINGFGRIGRMVLRSFMESDSFNELEFVAINDLSDIKTNAHLFKYDSVHGKFNGDVTIERNYIVIKNNNKTVKILCTQERDPINLPWGDLGVGIVMECSGFFTERKKAEDHIKAGAKYVLISAPAKNPDITVVYGVNHKQWTVEQKIISNASCTTNCLAPIAFCLDNGIGISHGYMTTIHSYTSDQRIIDSQHKDLRRSRSASLSMIPTSTGAASAVGLVLPNLKGKLLGSSIRVPTANVSVVDFNFVAKRKTSDCEINEIFTQQSKINVDQGGLKGVLGISNIPLVSIDFMHDSRSSIVDLMETTVLEDTFVRILSWYDNEWGFANRMCDFAVYINSKNND